MTTKLPLFDVIFAEITGKTQTPEILLADRPQYIDFPGYTPPPNELFLWVFSRFGQVFTQYDVI
jgi:hypothetical protein